MFLMEVSSELALLLLAICIVPIAVLIILAIIIRTKKSIAKSKQIASDVEHLEKDLNQRKIFYDAYGGEENVTSFDIERNKISVKVVDVTKVDGEALKNLGANGVLIIGEEVRCSYGDRAQYIYELLQR